MFDGRWEGDGDAVIGMLGMATLLAIFAFGLGMVHGAKREQTNAVKAGVAHYVADEQGNSKFEYNK